MIRFFSILAFSEPHALGYSDSITRQQDGDFDLLIGMDDKGEKYHVKEMLSDIGADAMCSRGTRVFRVLLKDHSSEVKVLKISWIEEGAANSKEADIADEIREEMGNDEFSKHFVQVEKDFTPRNAMLERIFEVLLPAQRVGLSLSPRLIPIDGQEAIEQAPIPPKSPHHYYQGKIPMVYPIPPQATRLFQPTTKIKFPDRRFEYRVLYPEVGISLYSIPSLGYGFESLVDVTLCEFTDVRGDENAEVVSKRWECYTRPGSSTVTSAQGMPLWWKREAEQGRRYLIWNLQSAGLPLISPEMQFLFQRQNLTLGSSVRCVEVTVVSKAPLILCREHISLQRSRSQGEITGFGPQMAHTLQTTRFLKKQ